MAAFGRKQPLKSSRFGTVERPLLGKADIKLVLSLRAASDPKRTLVVCKIDELVCRLLVTNRKVNEMLSRLALFALFIGLSGADVAYAQSIRVTLLGSGGPEPHPTQFGASTLIEAGEEKLIFDAGRGATIRLAQAKVSLTDITVFITHLHSDHLNGLSDLWTTGYIPPTLRRTPLEIYGPPGIVELAGALQVAFNADRDIRSTELGERGIDFSIAAGTFDATEVGGEGIIFDRGGVKVSAISVDHGASTAFAYRVEYAGRSVVLSGDTRFSKNLMEKARGADLIIHEVMAIDEKLLKGSPMLQAIVTVHTTPEDAGTLFSEVEPKMAVYNHIIRVGASDESIETATRKTYSGPLTIGQDLMTFVVDDEVSVINR